MKIGLYALAILGLLACNRAQTIDEHDDELIQDYLEENNIDAQKDESGLYYYIDNPGNNTKANSTSTVRVAYKGYLLDGSVFDQSDTAGISFGLWQVIQGWQIGIPYYGEGGNGKLFVPSSLGYGGQERPSIPAHSVLVFDIEVKDVY